MTTYIIDSSYYVYRHILRHKYSCINLMGTASDFNYLYDIFILRCNQNSGFVPGGDYCNQRGSEPSVNLHQGLTHEKRTEHGNPPPPPSHSLQQLSADESHKVLARMNAEHSQLFFMSVSFIKCKNNIVTSLT